MKLLLSTLCFWSAFWLIAENIPYMPGTVIVSREYLKDWKAEALDKDSSAVYEGPGIVFKHYTPSGVGKFVLSKSLGNVDCRGFDRFIYEPGIANYSADPKLAITGFLETDCGIIKSLPVENLVAKGVSYYSPCIVFDVSKAKVIKNIRLNVTLTKTGRTDGVMLNGILMLRNTVEHENYRKHYKRFADLKWEGLIRPENYNPQFKLQYEILFSNSDLEKYRKLYGRYIMKKSVHDIASPEKGISWHIGSDNRTSDSAEQYLRYYKNPHRGYMWVNSSDLSFLAILKKDKELMLMAARYILSAATFGAWTDDPREDTVGGDAGRHSRRVTIFSRSPSGWIVPERC